MEVSIPVWDHQKCVESFTDSVFDENICAGGFAGGQDACQVWCFVTSCQYNNVNLFQLLD